MQRGSALCIACAAWDHRQARRFRNFANVANCAKQPLITDAASGTMSFFRPLNLPQNHSEWRVCLPPTVRAFSLGYIWRNKTNYILLLTGVHCSMGCKFRYVKIIR